MPDTFFTAPPHWGWYIVLYFFVGGIAGGCFFLGALLRWLGRADDLPAARLAVYVAFLGALVSGLLLTVDLYRPERFWHMLIQSNTGRLMLKAWSPMSVGAWGVLLFGGFALLATLQALAEEGRVRWPAARLLTRRGPALLIHGAGSLFGFFLAGYTGVLLSVSNRPIWADSQLLGLLFLVSAASTAAAALILLSRRLGRGHDALYARLAGFDRRVLWLELLALAAFLVSLGPAHRALVNAWGLLLLVGTVGAGIVAPLWLERAAGTPARRLAPAAALVLVGGLVLRMVVILGSEEVHVAGTRVVGP
jgi:formate-dependent nitrite reductase membrane component NrfD